MNIDLTNFRLQSIEKKLAKAGIEIDLSGQLYEGGSAKSSVVSNKKTKEATTKKAKDSKTAKPVGKTAKPDASNNGNTTLENLLEKTIETSDDEDDDDYEPTADEIAEADRFVQHLLSGEESDDENDTTLNRLLNDTIDSDDSDDDEYEPTPEEIAEATNLAQKFASKLSKVDSTDFISKKNQKDTVKKPAKTVQKKQKAVKSDNNTTLDNLLNNTIQSNDSEGEDYEPSPEEIKKAKLNAQKVGKKLQKKEPPVKNDKKPLAKEQKKRKGDNATITTTTIESPELSKQELPLKKKKKVAEPVTEPATPKPLAKVRKNYVTALTPEPVQQKNKPKAKPASKGNAKLTTEKPIKTKKNGIAHDAKKPAKAQKVTGIPTGKASPEKTKQPKKGLNKKK